MKISISVMEWWSLFCSSIKDTLFLLQGPRRTTPFSFFFFYMLLNSNHYTRPKKLIEADTSPETQYPHSTIKSKKLLRAQRDQTEKWWRYGTTEEENRHPQPWQATDAWVKGDCPRSKGDVFFGDHFTSSETHICEPPITLIRK